MTEEAARGLEGFIDHADWHGIRGWAYERSMPDEPVWLEVQVDELTPITFLANLRRQDLVEAGYGNGTFAFDLRFPVALDPRQPHRITVRRRRDLAQLDNSPITIEAAPLGSALQRAIFEAMLQAEMAATEDGPELDRTIASLLQRTDALLDTRAQAASGAAALHQFRLRWNDYLDGIRARPLQPDARPWVLFVAVELPEGVFQINVIRALQSLGFRIAVVCQRDLAADGAVAAALAAMDVLVFGRPQYYSVEDILRRNRLLFRAVILWGTLTAAAYALITRMNQPKARILSFVGDMPIERIEPAMLVAAALLNDTVLVDSEAAQSQIAQRLGGRQAVQIEPEMSEAELAALFTPLLPRLRITRQADAADPS